MIFTNFVPPKTEEFLNFLKFKKNSGAKENSIDERILKQQSSFSKNSLDSKLCLVIEKILCNISEKIKSPNLKIYQINQDYVGFNNFINKISVKINNDPELLYNHFKTSKCECETNANKICKEINEIHETLISKENSLQKSIVIDLTSEESENEREEIQTRDDKNIIGKQIKNESNELFGQVKVDASFENFFKKTFDSNDSKITQKEKKRNITFLVEPTEEHKVYKVQNFVMDHDNNENISYESSNNQSLSKKRSRQNSLEINSVTDSRKSDEWMKQIQKIKKNPSNPQNKKLIKKIKKCINFQSVALNAIESLKSNNSKGFIYKNVEWIATKKNLFEKMGEIGDKTMSIYKRHCFECKSCDKFVQEHYKRTY